MLAKVFHLDRGIVGNPRKVLMQRLDNAHGVRRSIPEIGVSESNVGSARLYLLADIGEYDVRLNHAKAAIVHVHNRTVAAAMFAAPAGFGVAGKLLFAADPQFCIAIQSGEGSPVGGDKVQPLQRYWFRGVSRSQVDQLRFE